MSTEEVKDQSPRRIETDDAVLTPEARHSPEPEELTENKKNRFDFDLNKAIETVKEISKDVQEKVAEAFKGDKDFKTDAEVAAEYKPVTATQGFGADPNSVFPLYGEVTMKRDTIKSQKKEADPALFDIEMEEENDEIEEQAGLNNKGTHKSFGGYFGGKAVAKKYEYIKIGEVRMFSVEKENSKGGFMSMFSGKLKRVLGFHEGNMLVGELLEDGRIKIKSKTHIERLFKLYTEKENSKKITLVFFNKELNPMKAPVKKTYWFSDREKFLQNLDEEITRSGGKLQLFYNKQAPGLKL